MNQGALCALLVALVLTGCDEATPPADPMRPVLTTVVEPVAAARTVLGTVEPRYRTELGFRVLGRLIARSVDVGDRVAQGQTVATIDPTPLRLAVDAARAALAQAEARLVSALQAEARKQALVAAETDTPQALDDAEQVRAGAEASVARARANLSKAVEQFGYAQVRAEFDGVVTAIGADVGQVVLPGESVVSVARPDVREAVIDVGTDFAAPLRPDLPFTVCHDLWPAVCAAGRVREIGPEADATTRTRRVRIALESPPETFRLGSIVHARFEGPADAALRVPGSAVLAMEQGTFLWLVDPRSRTVSLHAVDLATDADGVRVIRGLTAGARVVTAGVHSLQPGQRVRLEGDSAP